MQKYVNEDYLVSEKTTMELLNLYEKHYMWQKTNLILSKPSHKAKHGGGRTIIWDTSHHLGQGSWVGLMGSRVELKTGELIIIFI